MSRALRRISSASSSRFSGVSSLESLMPLDLGAHRQSRRRRPPRDRRGGHDRPRPRRPPPGARSAGRPARAARRRSGGEDSRTGAWAEPGAGETGGYWEPYSASCLRGTVNPASLLGVGLDHPVAVHLQLGAVATGHAFEAVEGPHSAGTHACVALPDRPHLHPGDLDVDHLNGAALPRLEVQPADRDRVCEGRGRDVDVQATQQGRQGLAVAVRPLSLGSGQTRVGLPAFLPTSTLTVRQARSQLTRNQYAAGFSPVDPVASHVIPSLIWRRAFSKPPCSRPSQQISRSASAAP